jgi:RimJ/RimL family protein N-acetyltransferase
MRASPEGRGGAPRAKLVRQSRSGYSASMLGQLHSERLHLRDVTPEDAAALFALDQDPEVMRFLGGVIAGDSVQRPNIAPRSVY